MNILFLTYQGDMAGSTNSILFLAKGLADRGHNVFVGCRKESLLYKLILNTRAIPVEMVFKGRIDLENIRCIRDLVIQKKIQIINAQSSLDRYTSILSRWLYKYDVKIVHTRRQTPKSSGGWLQRKFYVKGTDSIITVSKALKRTFVKKGFPESHIQVIHNGTPTGRYKTISPVKTENIKKKFKIYKNDIVVGCVSRHKRQYQLIEALKYLPDHYKVIFVGIEKDKLQEQIERLKPNQTIHFAGRVNGKEVLDYYSIFDVHVLPSITEGFGLVLVEAMALGVPVVGTASEGILDVIQDEENGLLFPDGDVIRLAEQIKRLIENKELRNKCIANGKFTALEKFSIENTLNQYELFFMNLIASAS